MAIITHKRGDTFSQDHVYSTGDTPIDLTGYTVAAKIRQNNDAQTLVQALTVSVTSAADGEYTISATAAQTAGWAVGNHEMDVEFTDGSGAVESTETITLNVVRDITYT